MKGTFIYFLAILVLFFVQCSESPKTEVVADAEVSMKVDGMMCAVGCAKFIEKKVAEMDGVSDCKVDFETGMATVSFSSTQLNQTDISDFVKELNDGQYSVEVLEEKKHKVQSSPKGEKTKSIDGGVRIDFPELVTYFMHRFIR